MFDTTIPPTAPYQIDLLLLDGFNSLALHAFLDPFRVTNYLSNANLFQWRFLGETKRSVQSSVGMSIPVEAGSLKKRNHSDMLVINSSWGLERSNQPLVTDIIRSYARDNRFLVGLDTGAFLMAFAGVLQNGSAAVHYEHIAAFRELFPDIEMTEALYTLGRNRASCCGGLAAADLALTLLHTQSSAKLSNAAARYIFQQRVRPPHEGQLPLQGEPLGYQAPEPLRIAIVEMEANLEEPLRIGEVARRAKLSIAQLERLFRKTTGVTPKRYYIDVRLDRARGLITQTDMPVVDVAIACGFASAAQFSRVYKSRFSLTPSRDRIEGRIPFQFRSFPSHAGL